jgi:transposase-like protein
MHDESKRKGQLVAISDGSLTETDARAMLERIRFPNGVHCILPDCGGAEVYRIEVKGSVRKNGKATGIRHLFKCKACRRQFSVTKGTIFEDSKIPLRTWIMVMYRMGSSKKGLSAHQVHREFGLSYESAWFMCHRIRYAMTDKNPGLLSGIVEADETYVGGKPRGAKKNRTGEGAISKAVRQAYERKTPVFGIKERGGRVKAHVMPHVDGSNIIRSMQESVDMDNTRLMTDEHRAYNWIGSLLPHEVIRHKSEYVRGQVHTQGIESFWAILKRGLIGTYHHVDAGYLNQYVQEFAFRANTRTISDSERFTSLLGQVEGRVDWYVGKQAKASVSEPE